MTIDIWARAETITGSRRTLWTGGERPVRNNLTVNGGELGAELTTSGSAGSVQLTFSRTQTPVPNGTSC